MNRKYLLSLRYLYRPQFGTELKKKKNTGFLFIRIMIDKTSICIWTRNFCLLYIRLDMNYFIWPRIRELIFCELKQLRITRKFSIGLAILRRPTVRLDYHNQIFNNSLDLVNILDTNGQHVKIVRHAYTQK